MKNGLIGLVVSDLRAKAEWLYGSSSARNGLKALCTDGTFAMLAYRLMQACHRLRLAPLAMLFNKLNVVFGQCIIGRGADFGPAFVLVHGQGVVINGSVRGGSGVKLEHQVTIGAEKGRAPALGDDVFVGAGAKILGGVRIGSGARIGANAVVLCDVPAGATAVGVPARVVAQPAASVASHRSVDISESPRSEIAGHP
jgi:serine O-acetyltransferase